MSYRDLQKKCREAGLPAKGRTEKLRENLLAHHKNSRIDEDPRRTTLAEHYENIVAGAKSLTSPPKMPEGAPTPKQKPHHPTEPKKSIISQAWNSITSFVSPRRKKQPEIIDLLDDDSDDKSNNESVGKAHNQNKNRKQKSAIPTSVVASPSAMSTISNIQSPDMVNKGPQQSTLQPVGEESGKKSHENKSTENSTVKLEE